jgi:hypothetical protein
VRRRAQIAAAALAACLASPRPARAFLGVGDTSFVTVIADPAETANWAAELARLASALMAAQQTLQAVTDLRAFAGDPRAAMAAVTDLGAAAASLRALESGAQTDADLLRAWQALGAAGRLSAAASLLSSSGPGTTMQVFGQSEPRDAALYQGLAGDAAARSGARGQIASEQSARSGLSGELTAAWTRFRSASTESEKQAILAEISELQAQDQVLGDRRRALLDDMDLAERQRRDESAVRSKAADEGLLAESALLNASAGARARASESDRMATLQKQPSAPAAADYSGVRLWTTADSEGDGP